MAFFGAAIVASEPELCFSSSHSRLTHFIKGQPSKSEAPFFFFFFGGPDLSGLFSKLWWGLGSHAMLTKLFCAILCLNCGGISITAWNLDFAKTES